MKFKVGDRVRVKYPDCTFHGEVVKAELSHLYPYAVSGHPQIDPGDEPALCLERELALLDEDKGYRVDAGPSWGVR